MGNNIIMEALSGLEERLSRTPGDDGGEAETAQDCIDVLVQCIVDEAYKNLDADRISFFSYNEVKNSLECKVSKDIKGQVISMEEKTIAGTTFRSGLPINVRKAKDDERHYSILPKTVGYETETLLCCPVVNDRGKSIGVVQALNKRPYFTSEDENVIRNICNCLYSIISLQDKLDALFLSRSALILKEAAVRLMACSSMEELSTIVLQLCKDITNCHDAMLLISNTNSLTNAKEMVRYKSDVDKETILMSAIPDVVIQALESRTIIQHEMEKVSPSFELLSGTSVKAVIICPLNINLHMTKGEGKVIGEGVSARNETLGALVLSRYNGESEGQFKINSKIMLQCFEPMISAAVHNLTFRNDNVGVGAVEQRKDERGVGDDEKMKPITFYKGNESPLLIDPSLPVPEGLLDWDFNALNILDAAQLCNCMGILFTTSFDLPSLFIHPTFLASYIRDISINYHDNPFHNLRHAVTVTHFTYMLINATNANYHLSSLQLFGIMLSAVIHDVDHPGNTNVYEINLGSPLALLYNDKSVLENHHCSTGFRIMRRQGNNILSDLTKSNASELRKVIVECVMATDMTVHFQLIDESKKTIPQSGGLPEFSEPTDKILLCKILLHAADLSNPVRKFHMTRAWADRIAQEFNDQIAKEEGQGMPVLEFMRAPDEKTLCKNETGFGTFVIAPMWKVLAIIFPQLQHLVTQLDENINSWKRRQEEIINSEEAITASHTVDSGTQ